MHCTQRYVLCTVCEEIEHQKQRKLWLWHTKTTKNDKKMQLATLVKGRKAPAMWYFESERVMILNSLEFQLEKLSYIMVMILNSLELQLEKLFYNHV